MHSDSVPGTYFTCFYIQFHSFAYKISHFSISFIHVVVDLYITNGACFQFTGRSVSTAISSGSALAFISAVLDAGGQTTRIDNGKEYYPYTTGTRSNNGREYYPYTTGKRPSASWFCDHLCPNEALGISLAIAGEDHVQWAWWSSHFVVLSPVFYFKNQRGQNLKISLGLYFSLAYHDLSVPEMVAIVVVV